MNKLASNSRTSIRGFLGDVAFKIHETLASKMGICKVDV